MDYGCHDSFGHSDDDDDDDDDDDVTLGGVSARVSASVLVVAGAVVAVLALLPVKAGSRCRMEIRLTILNGTCMVLQTTAKLVP